VAYLTQSFGVDNVVRNFPHAFIFASPLTSHSFLSIVHIWLKGRWWGSVVSG